MDTKKKWMIGALAGITILIIALIAAGSREKQSVPAAQDEEHHEEEGEGVIELSVEAMNAAGIQYAQVVQRTAVASLKTTGTIEANQVRMHEVTPLVSGRVEGVFANPGDRVAAGAVLAVISSPEIAELHGKEIESVARLNLARSTLRRLQRLSELGAAAGKDLAAAEAEVETAEAELGHIRASLVSLGSDERVRGHSISSVALRAPMSGTVTRRLVNAGAGVQAGMPLFAIADLSTVWVIANVPESQIQALQIGSAAVVRSAALGPSIAEGRVTYIDPILNEETRTAQVRVEVANPNQQLRIGTFVEVDFEGRAALAEAASELVVPDEAIQTIQNQPVVFVPGDEPGHFEVREIQTGGQTDGLRIVVSGLSAGERVVTRGSFVLKTQMLKGEMGEHGH